MLERAFGNVVGSITKQRVGDKRNILFLNMQRGVTLHFTFILLWIILVIHGHILTNIR